MYITKSIRLITLFLIDMTIYKRICEDKKRGQKLLTMLIDPDNNDLDRLFKNINVAIDAHIDYFFLGGSLLFNNNINAIINHIKTLCQIPVVLFPGSQVQVNNNADCLLLPSVISGRNADLLIGKHVEAAGLIKASNLETISLGYMLIDSGTTTTVHYMSNTQPIPYSKPDIATATAIAGEMLGLQMLYLEAGSGAQQAVSQKMINAVSQSTNVPLIVGGGIRSPETAQRVLNNGADMIVIGTALENNINLVYDLSAAVHSITSKSLK